MCLLHVIKNPAKSVWLHVTRFEGSLSLSLSLFQFQFHFHFSLSHSFHTSPLSDF